MVDFTNSDIFNAVINFYNYIHNTIVDQSNEPLIVWPDSALASSSVLTGNKLLKQITYNRQQLISKNIKQGDRVLVGIPVSIKAVTALLSIQSIGATPVLPSPKAKLLVLLSILKKLKIKSIILDKKPPAAIRLILKLAGVKIFQLKEGWSDKMDWQPVLVEPQQPALITYSSGSTGKAKAILRSHGVLSAQHLVLKQLFPPWQNQRDFPLFPNIILHNLACGVNSFLPFIPAFQIENLDPSTIVKQIISHKIETLTGNVFYFKKLIKYAKDRSLTLPFVKAAGIGGSPVPVTVSWALKRLFPNAACFVIYGSSEAEPIAVKMLNDNNQDPLNGYEVGKPCEALTLKITATYKVETPEGMFDAGEIEVKGAHLATTIEKEWLLTGDYGYLNKESILFLTGRKGNETPYHKLQHYQVEHLLMNKLDIEHVAAISEQAGFKVYIQGNVSEASVKEVINRYLPEGVVKVVYFTNKIPLDTRHQSKILYHQIK